MRKLIIAALLGFLAGQLLAPTSAYAQQIVRLYGTFSGAAKAITVDTNGYVNVVLH